MVSQRASANVLASFALAGASLFAMAAPAAAQTSSTPSNDENETAAAPAGEQAPAAQTPTAAPGYVDEGNTIIVTARKREETLQDVPASVTAFSRDRLQDLGIRDITEVANHTPGFAMQNASRQNEQPFIRGMSVNSVFRQAQNASFFIDGIYVSGVGRTIGMDDLERIEVVLGPQAVYYGRATFAGAINYISRRPQLGRPGLEARTTMGENGLFDLSTAVNVPFGDTLAVRLFAQHHKYEGEYRNSLDNRKLGTEKTRGVSGSIRWQPTPNLDIIGRVQLTDLDDGHSPVTIYNPLVNNNCLPNSAGRNQFYCGELRNPQESDIALNLNELYGAKGVRGTQQTRYSLLANLDLGGFTVSSVTGYNKEAQQLISDGDATRFRPQSGLLQSYFDSKFSDTFQELRVSSPAAQRIRAMAGGSFFSSKRIDSSLLFPIVSLASPRRIRNKSVFGSLAVDLMEGLTATAEGRYQVDRINVVGRPLNNSFKSFLPRGTIDFQPTRDLMFYATVGKGNKPGDFNTAVGVPLDNIVVKEEKLWNYEAGAKTQWFDRRLTVNLTGYRINWTNQAYQDTLIQRDANGNIIFAPNGQPRTVVATINAGKTRINGMELDSTLIVLPGWSARMAYSYNDATFRDFLSRLPITYSGAPAQVAGNRLFNSPKHKLTMSTTYERPLPGSAVRLFGSTDLTYRGKQYTDELNTAYIGNLTLWNARLGVNSDRWELFAYGRNLTDSKVPDFATRSSDFNTSINSYLFTLRPGRAFGVTAGVKL
jgi:outer membrane receptor protein involved in Fe transport